MLAANGHNQANCDSNGFAHTQTSGKEVLSASDLRDQIFTFLAAGTVFLFFLGIFIQETSDCVDYLLICLFFRRCFELKVTKQRHPPCYGYSLNCLNIQTFRLVNGWLSHQLIKFASACISCYCEKKQCQAEVDEVLGSKKGDVKSEDEDEDSVTYENLSQLVFLTQV